MTRPERDALRALVESNDAGVYINKATVRALLDAADERDRLLAGSAARTMDFTYDTLRAAAEQAYKALGEALGVKP